eukprot:CAMPEP_0114405444 /NCGR_PEP_ID=MMETSP0102-20121206/20341_1 /TAXON_ID=38822 ORGANISM="Pteridomonas danica, Strain PT" /NCGR_SAMPLE_ID=MMETSP0102 /ASSEMBLY_ACC=CAM_ASM_000212 /LENGTH=137 /DNA_ID=CAMNT_0001570703 /DNA_START=164 /DNA_END=574 /DNA_ORIENTATION=-
MIRRQEKLLIELAEVDSKLLELESETRQTKEAKERYVTERGGDVATGLLRALHEDDDEKEVTSDIRKLYSLHQPQKLIDLPPDNDMTLFGGVVESRPGTSASRKSKSASGSRPKTPSQQHTSAVSVKSPTTATTASN